jgi:quercetin dioxygenase-like cupin family protein
VDPGPRGGPGASDPTSTGPVARGPAAERTFVAAESATPWEHDPPNQGDTAEVRWRTLVSADRTPSSGLSMGVFEVPPGARLAPHHHAPREVYYVTDGEAEVYAEGAWQPLRAGDVAYFPGGAVHGARNRGAATCRIVWIFPVDDYQAVEYIDDEGT